MNLGKRVEQERVARKLTQSQLCNIVGGGLTQQALAGLEKRDSKTTEHAPSLADALQVSLRWLLTGQGAKDEADWPFAMVARARWDACSPEERGYVQGAINRALTECEEGRPKGKRNGTHG